MLACQVMWERFYGLNTWNTANAVLIEGQGPTFANFMKLSSNGQKVHFAIVQEQQRNLFEVPDEYSLVHSVAIDLKMSRGIAVDLKCSRTKELQDSDLPSTGAKTISLLSRHKIFII